MVPAQQTRAVKLLASVDTSTLHRTPPLQASPPVQSKGVVRLGDTVMSIAQRYGLTMAELLKLNPGMQTARLLAGNEVELVQAGPVRQRAVLGLKPSTSGGLSWPQIPGLGTEMTQPKPSNNRRLACRQRLAAQQPSWRSYLYTHGRALKINWVTWKLGACRA